MIIDMTRLSKEVRATLVQKEMALLRAQNDLELERLRIQQEMNVRDMELRLQQQHQQQERQLQDPEED